MPFLHPAHFPGRPIPLPHVPLRPDSPILTILREKTPVVVPDVHNEPRFARVRSLFTQYDVSSLLLLPLTVENEAIGFLALGTLKPGKFRHLDDKEVARFRKLLKLDKAPQ